MIIYLIRHARQNSTLCNVNVPLSEEGEHQARLLGERMRNYPIDAIYTSDLIRAVETARIAFADREELLRERVERTALQEFDFGALTGQKDEIVKSFYRDYYLQQAKRGKLLEDNHQETVIKRQQNISDMAYPEGEDGEEVFRRVLPVLQEMITSGKKQIAVVTHGGVIRVILAALFGGDVKTRLLFGTSLENCGITKIHYDEDKKLFFLDSFNDAAHLESAPELFRKNW